MASNTQIAPVSPEILREQLLSPLPHVSVRAVVIAIAVIAFLGWSWNASQPGITNRVSGPFDAIYHFADLAARMFPPDFELARGTQTTVHLFGKDMVIGWLLIIDSVLLTIQMAVIGTI